MSKYWTTTLSDAPLKTQRQFEKTMSTRSSKSSKNDCDCFAIDNFLVIYKWPSNDVCYYLIVDSEENEINAMQVLTTFDYGVNEGLREQTATRKSLLENYDLLVIAVDELFENGCVNS